MNMTVRKCKWDRLQLKRPNTRGRIQPSALTPAGDITQAAAKQVNGVTPAPRWNCHVRTVNSGRSPKAVSHLALEAPEAWRRGSYTPCPPHFHTAPRGAALAQEEAWKKKNKRERN